MAIGERYRDSDLVFANVDGSPRCTDYFSKAFSRRVLRSGLPRISFHGLRHGWATMALEAGVQPKVVQERLGHSSITLRLDAYSHVVESIDEAASQTVAHLVFRPQARDAGA